MDTIKQAHKLRLCPILGIIFILSGMAKAFNVNSFAYEVRLYSDLKNQ